ncbi:MAG: protein kinase domain-containing protein [Rubripirellula sp.]
MTNASTNRARSADARPSILGIWRIGESIHESNSAELSLAQPADAAGSPRWDYVIKRAIEGQDQLEGRRQILQFIASATGVVHPNLVPVLDASTTASLPYLVMPRLEGQSMKQHLDVEVRKPLPVALWLVRQVAQALDSLHGTGWVHGDVKPENAMVGPRGHVTLVDLGFASRIHTVPNHHYRGTPAYSAPEALAGEMAAMPAMDIFSLGRVLWQWLTCTEQVHQGLLEPVAELVETMVSNDPLERPTAANVVKQLLRLEIETLGRHIGPTQPRRSNPIRRAA